MMRGKNKKLENLNERRPSVSNNLFKTPSLIEQTAKIEQKLSHLKQKILQKKKISVQDRKPPVQQALSAFMVRIGLSQYVNTLVENGIDSYQILKEIKQTELEEIGVLKGHALKIVVNWKKDEEKLRKKSVNQAISEKETGKQREETKPTLSQSTIRQNTVVSSQVDSIQTESFPIQTAKKSFCLYCFTRSEGDFCSGKCQQLYNGMFSRYEQNLQRAEESFMPPPAVAKEEELSDDQEFLENFDFLFNPQEEAFNVEEYQEMKSIARK